MAGDAYEAHMCVLLVVTVFMRLVFIWRRNGFQQRLRLLTIRGRRRRTEAYLLHSQRICRRRKVAWVLERPQFWFEHMLLNQYANNTWCCHLGKIYCPRARAASAKSNWSFTGGTTNGDLKELISYVSWMLCFSSVNSKRKETHLPALTALGSFKDLERSLNGKLFIFAEIKLNAVVTEVKREAQK